MQQLQTVNVSDAILYLATNLKVIDFSGTKVCDFVPWLNNRTDVDIKVLSLHALSSPTGLAWGCRELIMFGICN